MDTLFCDAFVAPSSGVAVLLLEYDVTAVLVVTADNVLILFCCEPSVELLVQWMVNGGCSLLASR